MFSYFYGSANPSWSLSCHVNSFSTGVLLLKWIRSFSTSARSTLSFLTGVCFIDPKLPLFSRPPTLFLRGLRFLNQVSILLMWSLSILFRQCSYPVILKKILTGLQVIIIRSFSSPMDSIRVFSVDHILFRISMFSHAVAPLNLPRLLFFCSGVLKISQKIRASILNLFKLFWGCYLIQAI